MGPYRAFITFFMKMARTTIQRTEDTARMAVIENDIKYIKKEIGEIKSNSKEDLESIKNMLKEHVKCESERYNSLDKKFAAKWVELGIITIATTVIAGIVLLLLGNFGG